MRSGSLEQHYSFFAHTALLVLAFEEIDLASRLLGHEDVYLVRDTVRLNDLVGFDRELPQPELATGENCRDERCGRLLQLFAVTHGAPESGLVRAAE